MNKYNIGDRVRVKTYAELPESIKNNAVARLSGKKATIEDRWYSEARKEYTYTLYIDGYDSCSSVRFPAEAIEAVGTVSYAYEFEYLENLVVARLYEVCDEVKTEVARGHGHIIHEGAYGIAQAASYALKKIAEKFNDGSLKRRDEE